MFSSKTVHDVKSILINAWMTTLFVAPLLWWFEVLPLKHCMAMFGEDWWEVWGEKRREKGRRGEGGECSSVKVGNF